MGVKPVPIKLPLASGEPIGADVIELPALLPSRLDSMLITALERKRRSKLVLAPWVLPATMELLSVRDGFELKSNSLPMEIPAPEVPKVELILFSVTVLSVIITMPVEVCTPLPPC